MREIVSIHIGQAGVQLGNLCWELYCLEHDLDEGGRLLKPESSMMKNPDISSMIGDSNGIPEGFSSFFCETFSGNYCPRALFIDMDPTVIDEIRTGKYKDLHSFNNLISGKEDAANNYARGHNISGKAIFTQSADTSAKMVEGCDHLQGFMITHSLGGGTGSGFYSRLTEYLADEFPKISKMEIVVFPCPKLSTAVVEPYNAVLATSATLETTDCVFLVNNEALYSICHKKLDIDSPSYSNLNRILAQAVSSITTSIRFRGSLNADFMDFQTNLVPYPRIHFPLMSFSPIVRRESASHEIYSILDITSKCLDKSNFMMQCDENIGRYMSCCLLYRGDVAPKEVNSAIAAIRLKKSMKFVNWSPTGFKIGINDSPPMMVPDGDLAASQRSMCMLCNTTAVQDAWTKLNVKFHVMLEKKAFIHWYLQYGLQETEFYDAQDNLLTLEQEYELMDAD
uniref:Tubulin alpha chain n=1 Tax=Lygus hesperus TaxID=30085 RepID=A0A0A9VPJ0_LYGHE